MLSIAYLFAAIACGVAPFNAHAQNHKPYVLSLPPLGIIVATDAKVNEVYRKQSNTILNGITLDEKLVLLNACSLGHYRFAMKDRIAAVQTLKQAHMNWADYVGYIEIPIEGGNKLKFEGPLQPDKKALFKKLMGNHFNEVGYRQLYQTTVKECNHEQGLLIKPLLTPDEFKKALRVKIRGSNTGSHHYIELPDKYATPHVPHIQEQLTPHINEVTTQQKIALLHLCNMAAHDTLTPMLSKCVDTLMLTDEKKVKLFENPSITTSLIPLSYDALYTDVQQLTTQVGTSEQKALFDFQVTPEELGALHQE